MQGSDDTEGGNDGGEKKPGKAAAANEVTDEGGATTNYDEEASTTATTLIIPTKTEDGGRNEQGQGQGETADSNRPDLFRTYSDNNVRMMSLLGREPSANPNDGEQQEDWRQLTGFTGIGEERRRNNDGGDNTTQRRTRLSAELHNSAFENMWVQQGLLDEPMQGQPPRQQQEEEDDGNSNSEENQQQEGC